MVKNCAHSALLIFFFYLLSEVAQNNGKETRRKDGSTPPFHTRKTRSPLATSATGILSKVVEKSLLKSALEQNNLNPVRIENVKFDNDGKATDNQPLAKNNGKEARRKHGNTPPLTKRRTRLNVATLATGKLSEAVEKSLLNSALQQNNLNPVQIAKFKFDIVGEATNNQELAEDSGKVNSRKKGNKPPTTKRSILATAATGSKKKKGPPPPHTQNSATTRSHMGFGDTVVTGVHKVPSVQNGTARQRGLANDEIRVPASTTQWSYNPDDKKYEESDRFLGVGQKQKLELPELVIKESRIPNAGKGVFTKHRIHKGKRLSEYGGRAIFRKEAMKLMKRKEDTHLKGAGRKVVGCAQLDGRITNHLDLDYYSSHHQVGSLFNGGGGLHFNAKYVVEEVMHRGKGYYHPHASSVSEYCHGTRVWLDATEDVGSDEELYVNYGTSFNDRNIPTN